MRRTLRHGIVLAAGGSLAAPAALLAGADRRDVLLDSYLLFLAGVVALLLIRLMDNAFGRPANVVPQALARRPPSVARPESLERLEDAVALARANALDLHFTLRPILQEIAQAGLATAGIDPLVEPARARPLLSPEAWALLRPDRERPSGSERRPRPGLLEAVVDELERILPA
jgi:hypothetical protein